MRYRGNENRMENIEYYIVKEIKGTLTPDECEFLAKWLATDDTNKVVYAKIRDVIALAVASNYQSPNKKDFAKKINRKISTHRWKRVGTVAATLTAITLVSWYMLTNRSTTPPLLTQRNEEVLLMTGNNVYKIDETTDSISGFAENNSGKRKLAITTAGRSESVVTKLIVPHGKTYSIELSDGTLVTLNAMSTLSFDSNFSDTLREVELVGEAFFDVAKDPKRLFRVKTKRSLTEVYGTSFNVNDYDNSPTQSISLFSGNVTAHAADTTVKLTPGEQFFIEGCSKMTKVGRFNPQEVEGWRNSMFIFANAQLEEITTAIERWYDVEFIYSLEQLKSIKIYVKIKKTSALKEILDALAATEKVRFNIQERKIYVMPKL